MSAITRRLGDLEKQGGVAEFPSSTEDLIEYVNTQKKMDPDEDDPIYKLFKWSYARQYLTYVTFVAGILVSILTEWEFVKCFDYKQWSYVAGILPVIIISIIIVISRHIQEKKYNKSRKKVQSSVSRNAINM